MLVYQGDSGPIKENNYILLVPRLSIYCVFVSLFPFNRRHQGTVGSTSQNSHLLPVWKAQDTGAVTAAIPQQEGLILILKKWCLRSGKALIIQYFHLSLAIQISIGVPVQATTMVGQVWKRPYDRTPSQAFKNCGFVYLFFQETEVSQRHIKLYVAFAVWGSVEKTGSRARSMNPSRPIGLFLCFELLEQWTISTVWYCETGSTKNSLHPVSRLLCIYYFCHL